MKIYSSAKINLNLTINKEIINGLHTLTTLMMPISLFDEIEIHEIESDNDIIEFDPQINIKEESTIHKALNSLRSINQFEQRFKIRVNKKIPVEAGLGGGSSNAGSLIKYLSTKYNLISPEPSIIANNIGSDVPFFIDGQTAKVSGVGEVVTPVQIADPICLLIATPHETLSTAKVFEVFDNQSEYEATETKIYNEIQISNNLWNSAITIEPILSQHKEYLEAIIGEEFFMSGSGTTLFCFGDEDELNHKKEKIDTSRFRLICVTKKIDCSLLQEAD